MKNTFFTQIESYLRQANQWYLETPERSLDQAYKAALKIKSIEDEHFDGKKISAAHSEYGESVISYFKSDLDKYLKTAKLRIAEFKLSRSILNIADQNLNRKEVDRIPNDNPSYSLQIREDPSVTIEKLNFIDTILQKYNVDESTKISSALVAIPKPNQTPVVIEQERIEQNGAIASPNSSIKTTAGDGDKVFDKTGALPRSILGTLNRIQQDLDPNSEEQIIQNYRRSKLKTVVSIKFILLLILVPLLVQQVSKAFLVGPIVEKYRNHENTEIFLNVNLEEEALEELERFEKQLEFRSLIGLNPAIEKEEKEEHIKEKAEELKEEYRQRSADAIKNVFADTLAVAAFCVLLVLRKRDIEVLKSFMDDVVYGLSDSAKAFIIILFTDVFVGFHSPHGWEVILEGISKHLGLPENREFIFLFIATFPVILDTMFKYWIFRYLNRISPSAVATYRNMNE